MNITRRRFVTSTTLAATSLAGCLGALSGEMTVTETRLAYDDGKIGVFVGLRDANPNRAGPVSIRATLLEDGEQLAMRTQEFDVGGNKKANVIVWFDDLSADERQHVTGASAEVAE